MIRGFELDARIVDLARVHVQGRGALTGYGDDHVAAVDVEYVDAVHEAAAEEPLRERYLIVPHAFGLQVGVLRREHVHLTYGGVAESLCRRELYFDCAGQVERETRLRHPFGAYMRVVVDAQAGIEGDKMSYVLAEIHVSGNFVRALVGYF